MLVWRSILLGLLVTSAVACHDGRPVGDEPTDAAVSCTAPQRLCGGECVEPLRSPTSEIVMESPVPIDSGKDDAERPSVTVDACGHAVAVWSQPGSGIWTNRYSAASQRWGTSTRIAAANAPEQLVLAGNPNGNAVVVWIDDSHSAVWASVRNATAGTWGEPNLLDRDSDTGHKAYSAMVVVHPSGSATVVWGRTGKEYNVWSKHYDAVSGTWAESQLLGPGTSAALGADAAGNAIAVGSTRDPLASEPGWAMSARRYSAALGSWGQAVPIGGAGGGAEQIAVDASGNVLVVWGVGDLYGGEQPYVTWANRFSATTASWGEAFRLVDDLTFMTAPARLAMASNGKALVVWGQPDKGCLWVRQIDAQAGTWGERQPLRCSDELRGGLEQWNVAMAANGNATAGWVLLGKPTSSGTDNQRWVQRYEATTGQGGAPQLVALNGNGYNQALDPSGNATVVWSSRDEQTGRQRIWATHLR